MVGEARLGHVSLARLATSAAARHRTAVPPSPDFEVSIGQQQGDVGEADLSQPAADALRSQLQPLTYDELQDARNITAFVAGCWPQEQRRDKLLRRRWPTSVRSRSNTRSIVEHARRGTFGCLQHPEAQQTDAAVSPQRKRRRLNDGLPTHSDACQQPADSHQSPAAVRGSNGLATARQSRPSRVLRSLQTDRSSHGGSGSSSNDDGLTSSDSEPEPSSSSEEGLSSDDETSSPSGSDSTAAGRAANATDRLQSGTPKRQRITREMLGLPPPLPMPDGTWMCVYQRAVPASATSDAQHRLNGCSQVNSVAEHNCTACGAARWDGEAGQLRARVAALLQTSDPDSTTLRKVMLRLAADSGNLPGAGLSFPRKLVQQEVDFQLQQAADNAVASGAQPALPPAASTPQADAASCATEWAADPHETAADRYEASLVAAKSRLADSRAATAHEAPEQPEVLKAAFRLQISILRLAEQHASDSALQQAAHGQSQQQADSMDEGQAPSQQQQHQQQQQAEAATPAGGQQQAADHAPADSEDTVSADLTAWQDTAAQLLREDAASHEQPASQQPADADPQLQRQQQAPPPAAQQSASSTEDDAQHSDEQRLLLASSSADAARTAKAAQHGANFAITLLEMLLHRETESGKATIVQRHQPPHRNFLGLPPAISRECSISRQSGTAAHTADSSQHTAIEALPPTQPQQQQQQQQPPPESRQQATSSCSRSNRCPVPVHRTLPAATLNEAYSRLPHYSSAADLSRRFADSHAPTSRFKNRYASVVSTLAAAGAANDSTAGGADHRDASSNAAAAGRSAAAASAAPQPSAFRRMAAHGDLPPPATPDCGWARMPASIPSALVRYGSEGAYYYEDPHTERIKRYYPPPDLPVAPLVQRREETVSKVLQLSGLQPDVRKVFEAAAEMGLPAALLRKVVAQFEQLHAQ